MNRNQDFCKACGALVDAYSKTCSNCGASLYNGDSEDEPTYRNMKNISSPVSTKREYGNNMPTKRPKSNLPRKSNKKIWAFIALGIIAFITLIVVLLGVNSCSTAVEIDELKDYKEKSLVLLVGEKFDLNCKTAGGNKVIWGTSDSKICTVDNNGTTHTTVQAMAAGSVTITAKVGSSTSSMEIIVKLDHEWDGGKLQKTSDCEQDGQMLYTCADCGETKLETVKATGHKYPEEPNKIDGDEDGCELTYICENCKDEKVEKIDHKFDEGEITKEPTCEDKGVKTYTCQVCDYEEKEEVDVVDHEYKSGKCIWCGKVLLIGTWKASSTSTSIILTATDGSFTFEDTDGDDTAGTWVMDSKGRYSFYTSDDELFGTAEYSGGVLKFQEAFKFDDVLSFTKVK